MLFNCILSAEYIIMMNDGVIANDVFGKI